MKIYNKLFVGIFSLCAFVNAQAIALTNGNETKAESAGTVAEVYTVSSFDANFTIFLSIKNTSTGTTGSDFSGTFIESYGTSNDGQIPVTGNGAYNVSYTLLDDNIDEENETLIITQTNDGGISSANKTVTITDNDNAPTMAFAATTGTDAENTAYTYFTVSLSHASTRSTLPAYTISIGGGSTMTGGGTDYNALNPTSYEFGSGSTTDQFYIYIQDDALDENDETIILSIATNNTTYATLGTNQTHTLTITDNDAPPTISFNASAANAVETNSGTAAKTAQVDISAVSAKTVSANYTITGTSTAGGTDHNLAAGTVSISAGNTNNTIGWNVIGEALYENDETIIITLSNPTNATLANPQAHTYTITNDDAAPTIAFTGTAQSNNEATTSYNVGVTLSTASGVDATMDYAVGGASTATGGGTDYTLANGTATITAGNTTTNIALTVVNDALYENDETIVIAASNPTGSSLGANTTFTYTIANNAGGNNDAKPTIQFNSATGTALESVTSFNIQLDLSAASGLVSTVDYALTAGNPAATGGGTDYTLADGTATIAAGATTANLATTVVNDVLDENNEIFIVTISDPNANVALGTNTTHTYTVQDNDDPPEVQFNATASSSTEGTNGTLKVDLSAASGKDITVDYAVQAASTATGGGTDYTLADGTLTISAGSTTENITLAGVDDALDEDDETVIVLLTNPTNSSLGTNATHTFTIDDNDATPTIQFNATSASYAEATENHTIAVDLSAAAGRDISVAYTLTDGTPVATGGGTDYTLVNGTLTITAGQTSNNITFKLINDALDEWAEKFIVTLSNNPTNADIGTNTIHTATITDNDALPTIDFAAATSSVNENVTPKTLTPTLSTASGKDIAVYYAVTAGTPAATGTGTDYTLANDSLKITAGNTTTTISAVIVNDVLDENNEKFVVTMSGTPDNVVIGGTRPAHTVTITDDDDPPTIAFSAINSAANEAVTPATMTVQLSGVSGLDITADYAVTGTASGNNVDYTLADGTVSITAGNTTSTVSATIIDDNVVEDDETVIVTLSNPTNATVGTNSAYTYTISNDDSPPADFKVDTVIATGGTVRFRYWNSTNTGLRVDVPVENSAAVVGGTIQLRAKKGILNYEDLSSPYTILSGDKATTKQMTATAAEFEAITGFAENEVITVTAIITDKYGNTTTGTASDYTTTIDQVAPAVDDLGTVTVTGGTVVSDYWNSTNTGVSAVVPILTTDPTLTDGTVQLQARSGSAGSWTSVDSESSISAAEATAGTKTITASASGTANVMDIEEIPAGSGAEVGDGKEFFFRVVMTDVAGNATNFNQSTSSPLQDQTVPTFTTITSSNDDKAYKILDTLLITPTMSEAVVVTGTPKFNLETGTSDGTAKYLSGSNSANLIFQYVVESGHTSSDLGYTSTNGFILDGGTVRDVAGNDLDLTTLPTAGAANSLKASKVIVIDTKLPFVTFTYDDPDTLVRFEDGTLNITATFSDSIQSDSIPKITVDFPGVTTGDVSAANMIRTSGTVFTYPLTLIDGSTGIITITISAYDKALNALPADSVFRGTAVTIDNIDPVFTLLSPDRNSYVNHAKVGYKLSETSFSGNVTWERIGGTVDANSPHIATLSASELDAATTFTDYSLTNIPTSLVSGTTYSITWSATDTAGNISADFISTPIYYDTTAPTAVLAYSQYFATADSVVTITATFNERALPKPQIAINYQGVDSDVAVTNMTMGADSTIWIYAAKIPGGSANNGLASISITATDLAGNSLRIADLTGSDTLVVDNTTPSVTLTYDDPDTLVRFEDAILLVTATFSDSITVDSIPKISVNMPSGTNGDISAGGMTLVSGKVYNYSLPLVDKADGIIAITVSAYDKALNAIVADSVFRGTTVTIDNTDPAAFTTGSVTAMGDTTVVTWINKATDSLKIIIPISGTDQSLLDGGDVNIEMRVPGKMNTSTWAIVATSDAGSPSAPADSIKQLSGNQTFFRKKEDIVSTLNPLGLAQGDTILIRGVMNDKVGNITYGAQSTDFFVLDTLPPTIGTHISDTLFIAYNKTNLLSVNRYLHWTNDTVSFAIKNYSDPAQTNEKASGIDRFEYAWYQGADSTAETTYTLFRNFKNQTNKLDTVMVDTFALTHLKRYRSHVRAVDVAGNTSDPDNVKAISSSFVRHNARPVIVSVPDTTVDEDVLWEQLIEVNDKDLLTLRFDEFLYALTTIKLDTTKIPIDSTVVNNLNAGVTKNGKVTFTPTKLDTASYVFRIIVTDAWTLLDTVDIDITVLPVNDPPILDLSSIAKMIFSEGANSDSINLTRYSYDEDNETTDLKYSFRIASTLPDKGGYPTAKIGFLSDFKDGYKQSFISKLVDEFPSSTIVQKNDAFLIYSASVNQFKDPIKVDSLVQGDSTFAWIMPTDTASNDTNYFTSSDMFVEFTVTDPSDSVDKDTIVFFINPLNDPPVWTSLPDTTIKENDSLYFDFADYLSDVDDSTLTISILPLTFGDNITIEPTKPFQNKATGIEYSSTARKEPVKFKPDLLWFGPNGPMVKNKTDSTLIQITAADDDTSSIDTFIVYVQRVPRPEIRMYVVQNNAFTNFYEIFLVDSVGKTKDLTLKIQSKAVTLDTAAAFTYVGHYNFKTKGTYTFEVDATGVVGDTSVTKNLGLALAKMYATWSGRSADGQFQVIGKNGVVDFDQSVMILDSTLFEPHFNDRASYLLGNEAFRFKKSVEISMPGEDEERAIYQRSVGTGWIELPSISQGNRVMAYTEKMGYFRMGPKTILVPGQTALQQNYPNPFNPVTTLEYDLGFVDGPYQKVSMTIYDILGRNVKTLVNEQQSIGRYRLKWNGKDQNGVNVASGIYFVHLLTDMGRSQTKKIMLVR